MRNFSQLPWGCGEECIFLRGTEPVSVSTFCSATQWVCQGETLVKQYHLSFHLCQCHLHKAVAFHPVIEWHLRTQKGSVYFQLGNPIGLQKTATGLLGRSVRISCLAKLMMYVKPGEEGGEVILVSKSS